MRDLYHRRYSVIVVVVLLSSAFCSKENRQRVDSHPEGVDYDESYRIKVTRSQKVISTTLTQEGHHKDITLTVSAFNATFVLDLHLNTYLFAVGYLERSFNNDGVVYHDVNHTESHCYYLGKVRDQPQSSAAVSTCTGIVGYFSVGNVSYHIDPASDELNGLHRVYRGRGDAKAVYKCGHENVSLDSLRNLAMHRKRSKRFAWPQDSDKKDKVVELYVANDYSQFKAKGSDVHAVIERTKNIVNIASAGYQPLGIYIVLVGVEVWNTGDKITINISDSNSTVSEWAEYRMTYVNPVHYNDNGILITNNTFDNSTVLGKGYIGKMCKNSLSAAFIGDVDPLPFLAGAAMAHEMGHNFGLVHDDQVTPCTCSDPSGNCTMNPIVTLSFKWSQCSLDQFAFSFEHGLDICLYNVPKTVQPDNAFCGNGIVENDEQCDCGNSSNQECNQACCNDTSCQLVYPATCAYGRCCNINSCQILSCGTLCRAKVDPSCGLDEYCDGHNHLCSSDTYLPDGANCTVKGVAAYCYNGQCRSHQSQCELLWGPGTLSSSFDLCYNFNKDGDFYGNCGLNWLPSVTYVPCASSDMLCGLLQCQDLSRNLSHYLELYRWSYWTYYTDTCHGVMFDFGLNTQDPGYVPSGASCGAGKMCVNQRCLEVSSLTTTTCTSSCQTNEVCNNLGQCQRTIGGCSQSTAAATRTTAQILGVVLPAVVLPLVFFLVYFYLRCRSTGTLCFRN